MPQRPAWSDCQNSPASRPRAEMTPTPVTATRCGIVSGDGGLVSLSTLQKLRDTVDHVAHGSQILSSIIGNIDIKFAFHREQDVDAVQRIDAELLEGAVGGDLLLGKMLGCGDDGPDPRRQFFVGHKISVTFSKWKPCSSNFGKISRTAWSVTPISGRR